MDPDPSSQLLESVFNLGLILPALALLILLLLSGLVSGSEVAFFSLTPNDLGELESSKKGKDELVLKVLKTPKQLLGTILISNNFLNISIVILTAIILSPVVAFYQDHRFTASLFGMDFNLAGNTFVFLIQLLGVTFLILLFGEILPKVYAKIATSKNYYSFIKNRPQITNIYSKKLTHTLRSEINAILIGVNTHNKDNPLLNCRIDGLAHLSPARFIIDPNLRINKNSKLIMTAKKIKTYIFYSDKNNNKINYLKNKNIYPIYLPLNKNKHIDCKEILVTIGLLGYKNVLIEGGYNTIKSFIDLNLIDIFYFFKNDEIVNKKSSHSFKNIYIKLKKSFKNNKIIQQVYLKNNTLTVFQK